MICLGARFDDRITGRLDAFSPNSRKVHVDIDPSSINKNVRVDLPIIGDVGHVLKAMLEAWNELGLTMDTGALAEWKGQIARWKARNCLAYRQDGDIIMPQHAVKRLYELTRDRKTYITTEVGQHQMWAAQFYGFEEPNRWMTSCLLYTSPSPRDS